MPTFPTPRPIPASVESAAGSVRLVATDRDDTVVEVRPRDDSRAHDVRAAEQARVDFRNDTLTVATPIRGLQFWRQGAVDIDIALPAGSRLRVSVVSADVSADGEYAECRAESVSGDISVGSVTGNIKADTVSGTTSVRAVNGAVSVSSASGGANIGALTGDVKFRTASGELRVERLHGDFNAQTASGDVSVATAVTGAVSAQTSSGEVEVGIAEGTAAQLDLHTGSGSVRNTLQPSDGPAEGDETLVVHARTGSGDVIVQRATAEAMS